MALLSHQCGAIREIIMIAQEADQTALVEFKFADAVPAALAKNGRRVEGQPISVAMLWRATLFVTNFPREMDDPAIRQLFSQVRSLLHLEAGLTK